MATRREPERVRMSIDPGPVPLEADPAWLDTISGSGRIEAIPADERVTEHGITPGGDLYESTHIFTERLATPEEIQRVRRTECTYSGHDWQIIETTGVGPTALVCGRCGESRQVQRAVPRNDQDEKLICPRCGAPDPEGITEAERFD